MQRHEPIKIFMYLKNCHYTRTHTHTHTLTYTHTLIYIYIYIYITITKQKNYGSIILTAIVANIYNALLLCRIRSEIEKLLRKYLDGFRRNRSTTSQILTIRKFIERLRAKKFEATLLFGLVWFVGFYGISTFVGYLTPNPFLWN